MSLRAIFKTALVSFCLIAPSKASILPMKGHNVGERDVTVTATDLSNFDLFAQYSAAAYCNVAGTGLLRCTSNACPEVEAAQATSTAEFLGAESEISGIVAVDPTNELIVVSFRGTHTILNWLEDVLFFPVPCTFGAGCGAHAGFLASWASIETDVFAGVAAALTANPGYKLITTGHSLGAALATLAGASLRDAGHPCDIYTFGSPRVGNNVFANYVTAQAGSEFRVTHLDDPVPRLPPILLGFRHTSPEYWLSDGNATTVDYTIADIKVCEGTANVKCNAGTGGFDTTAHSYYLGPISGCSPDKLEFRDLEPDMETKYAKLVMYAAVDIEYAGGLEANGSVPTT